MMTPKEFKILMIQNDIRATDIAKKFKVTPQFIWALGQGYSTSKRIEDAIAQDCGRDRKDIFPIIPEPRGKAA